MISDDFDSTVAFFMDEMGGSAVVSIEDPAGTYDPDTGDYAVTSQDYTVRAILLDLTLRSNGLQTVPNTLIETGDKRCLIQPIEKNGSPTPMPKIKPNKDRVTMGGITYKIVTLKDYNPSATNSIMLDLILRE